MTAQTEWRDIAGHEGRYQVSKDGRVKSLAREVPNGRGTHFRGDVELVGGRTGSGYLSVALYGPEGHRTWSVHRLVALAFLGPPPFEGAFVLHGDGDRLNNDASNLRWGTRSENAIDSIEHGTHPESRLTHCGAGHRLDDEAHVVFEVQRSGRTRRVCRLCATARRAANRRKARAAAVPDHVHGTQNGYVNYFCRCGPCTQASTQYCRERRARLRGIA